MGKIVTYVEIIEQIRYDLSQISISCKDKDAAERINKVITEINTKILYGVKDVENTLKRMLYNRMTALRNIDREQSLELYKVYQLLKEKCINTDEALNRLHEINEKYKEK